MLKKGRGEGENGEGRGVGKRQLSGLSRPTLSWFNSSTMAKIMTLNFKTEWREKGDKGERWRK
jgi:hypothetical protein